jgi:hypothetical protein
VPDLQILIDGIGRGLSELDGEPASAGPASAAPGTKKKQS